MSEVWLRLRREKQGKHHGKRVKRERYVDGKISSFGEGGGNFQAMNESQV